ncbi:MAG: class I SAM-dependent methyltransferase [Syntrophorhabdaceae bacterium]|nr:class I SAM-dependent methyltransferase [Syntrophorhabdaceae bacterium]
MKKSGLWVKVFNLQHKHDYIIDLFKRASGGGRLLEAGAREGNISKKLLENGFTPIAVDINMPENAIREFPWVKANLNHGLPFKDKSFDLISCTNTIEYLEDDLHFIRESYRILSDKGKLLIGTPNLLNLQSRISLCLTGFFRFSGRPYDELHQGVFGERRWNLRSYYQLRAHLHRNGFRIISASSGEYSNKAMLFFPLSLLIYLITHRAFNKEKDPVQRERNKEILRHVMSLDLLFGKYLYLLAEKDPSYLKHRWPDGRNV